MAHPYPLLDVSTSSHENKTKTIETDEFQLACVCPDIRDSCCCVALLPAGFSLYFCVAITTMTTMTTMTMSAIMSIDL